MEIESTEITATDTTEVASDKQTETPPGKLLLGKRVLRHFGVRTAVQTGSYSGLSRRT